LLKTIEQVIVLPVNAPVNSILRGYSKSGTVKVPVRLASVPDNAPVDVTENGFAVMLTPGGE
jgi:hypothetical protein